MENCVACQDEKSLVEKSASPVASKGIANALNNTQRGGGHMYLHGIYNEEQGPVSTLPDKEKGIPRLEEAIKAEQGSSQHRILALSIKGMTCASCASSITHALESLEFVRSAKINLLTNSATVAYNGADESPEKIVGIIGDVGFDASIVDNEALLPATPALPTSQFKPEKQRYKAILHIGGMTCGSCAGFIEESLYKLPFTENVQVTLLTNGAIVTFINEENLESIIYMVKDLGYECVVQSCDAINPPSQEGLSVVGVQQRSILVKIDGMFCKHCPSNIVDALNSKFSALLTVDKPPSLKEPIMQITYTPVPPDFTIRDILSTINGLSESFKATPYRPPSIEQRSQAMQIYEQHRLSRRLLLSFSITIPTFLIGVVWMSLVPSTNKIRMFFEESAWSGTVTRAEWALFVLASLVMFFAADLFHIRAIKEIRALWRSSRIPILRRFYRFGSMNLLISAGTSVAYFSSLALLIIAATSNKDSSSHNSTYFDSVVFLTFFILIGRYLEAYSKSKTGNAVALLGKFRPQQAILVSNASILETASGNSDAMADKSVPRYITSRVGADLLEVADVVLVPHGSSPPADGIILTGSTKLDESSLTGESRAVSKFPNDKVFAGTVNFGDPISIRITDVAGTSMLDQVISVIREGQTRRAPVERVVDSMTGYFVPIITALAILTFFIWFSLGQSGALSTKYLGSQEGGWAFWSLEFAIAVFVVACPCGIGLAAPTALFVGGGLAATNGILVRGGGEAFQEASNVDIVVFDKTGTLTEGGNLKVTDHEILVHGAEADIVWSVTKALEENSSHPIARALLELASTRSTLPIQITSIDEIPGLGLRGTFSVRNPVSKERLIYQAALGSECLLYSLNPTPEPLNYFTTNTLSLWKSQSKSIALLALRRFPDSVSPSELSPINHSSYPWKLSSLFAISDPIRPSALPTIAALKTRNIPVYMLTGDNPTTAAAVASSLSIPLTNVFAGVLPTEKAAKIQHLQAHGPRRSQPSYSILHRYLTPFRQNKPRAIKPAIVAFIGDGINDAPALTAASVSISLASASDIALSSSSFVLLSPSLQNIVLLLDLSKRVFRRVRFNFAWAVGYNALLIPIAAGVLFRVGKEGGWRLGPVWGSAAMAASSLSVVCSSLALRLGGERRKEE